MKIGEENPLLTLLGAIGNPERGITESFRNGQSALNGEAVIPVRLNAYEGDGKKLLTDMGFTLGGSVQGDPLFQRALLPEGWQKKSTNHYLWSNIIDSNGFIRFEVFFSSVMWDREAFMNPSIRIYCNQQYREGDNEDGPKLEESGITRWRVTAALPGGVRKNVKTFDRPISYRESMADDEVARRAYFQQSDELRDEARAWMLANYPECKNPLAYWDVSL